MFDDSDNMRPFTERKAMQEKYGTHILPIQDLSYATYTRQNGERIICDVLGTDESEHTALLCYLNEAKKEREIWIAERDQSGSPGTWLWTEEQLKAAKRNPVRISDEENSFNFRGDTASERVQVAPIHRDRRIEILMLGLTLGKSDTEVRQRLRAESLDDTLPENYRTEQGELDLLKNWLPE